MRQIAGFIIAVVVGGFSGKLWYAATPGFWDAATIPISALGGAALLWYAALLRRQRAERYRVLQAAGMGSFAGAVAFMRAGSLVGLLFVAAGAICLLGAAHPKRSV